MFLDVIRLRRRTCFLQTLHNARSLPIAAMTQRFLTLWRTFQCFCSFLGLWCLSPQNPFSVWFIMPYLICMYFSRFAQLSSSLHFYVCPFQAFLVFGKNSQFFLLSTKKIQYSCFCMVKKTQPNLVTLNWRVELRLWVLHAQKTMMGWERRVRVGGIDDDVMTLLECTILKGSSLIVLATRGWYWKFCIAEVDLRYTELIISRRPPSLAAVDPNKLALKKG